MFRCLAVSASTAATRDTLWDFKATEGDRIDLSAIDPDAAAGDQAFA